MEFRFFFVLYNKTIERSIDRSIVSTGRCLYMIKIGESVESPVFSVPCVHISQKMLYSLCLFVPHHHIDYAITSFAQANSMKL